MKRQEAIKILGKHKEHLKELISEGEEYYHYVPAVEAINCISETNTYFEACTPVKSTMSNISTEDLVRELGERDLLEKDFIAIWSKPLIELLIAEYNPHTQIIISTEGVRIAENIKVITQ